MCAVDFKGGRKKAARECVRSTSENVRSCRLDESFLFLLLGGETDHPWRKLGVGVSENTRSASVKCETNRGGGRKKKKKEKKKIFVFFLFLPRHRFWCEARHGWEEASVVCLDS